MGRCVEQMNNACKQAKSAILHFKLKTCCCFAPIRTGMLCVGYFNLFMALLSLVGTAAGGLMAPLMEVQDELLEEEEVSVTAGVIAYASEVAFSSVLLCAVYRSDIVLLQVYIYFMMATIVSSLMIYSIVIAKLAGLTKVIVVGYLVYNCYVIILVRSLIVEIKERLSIEKNGHVVLYSVGSVSHDDRKVDIQAIEDTKEHDREVQIEIVDEVSHERIDEEIHDGNENNDKNGEGSKKDDKVSDGSKTDDEKHAKLQTVKEEAIVH